MCDDLEGLETPEENIYSSIAAAAVELHGRFGVSPQEAFGTSCPSDIEEWEKLVVDCLSPVGVDGA